MTQHMPHGVSRYRTGDIGRHTPVPRRNGNQRPESREKETTNAD